MPDLAIVDAHQHFWDPAVNYHPWLADRPVAFRYGDYAPLKRRYLPEDYFRDAASHHIVKTVYVETEWDAHDPVGEMEWVSALRVRTGFPTVAVAQAWLDRDDAEPVLAGVAEYAFVRGIRHKPGDALMRDARWRRGFARLASYGLSFDLQAAWTTFSDALVLARDFPGTQIILNHTGLPADRSDADLDGWRRAMRTLAQAPNVAVKISGLGVPGQAWTVEANRGIVLDTIACFGTERCMFASNFPVDSLVATFAALWSGFDTMTRDFSDGERRALFHDNAIRLYRMP